MNQSVGPKPSQPERSCETADPRAVLRSVFGYADFRGPQEAIVRHEEEKQQLEAAPMPKKSRRT
jgi:superfamily II DNA helicase RecQ